MKISLCILLIAMGLLFASCKKEIYKCSCKAHIHYFAGISPPSERSYDYNSESIINQKMTHKKALSACKDIEYLFLKGITPVGSEYSIQELTGGCELK